VRFKEKIFSFLCKNGLALLQRQSPVSELVPCGHEAVQSGLAQQHQAVELRLQEAPGTDSTKLHFGRKLF
jgi:hypothetical protein